MPMIIPGSLGLPFLGETLQLVSDPLAFFGKRYRRYGPVFQTRVFGKTSVVLFGTQAQRQVLLSSGDDPLFQTREGYSILKPFIGTSLLQMDGLTHQTQRKLITPAFQSHNYADYLIRINNAYNRTIGEWPEYGTATFYQEARAIAFRISTSLMLGLENGPAFAQMSQLLHALLSGPTALPFNLPFTTYGKATAAKPIIDRQLRAIIARRRDTPTTDVLSLFLQARDEEGQPLSDEQLLAHLKLLLFGGYDTTTATLAWCLIELLRRPELHERLRAEVKAETVSGEEPIRVDELRTMPLLDAFIKETLRLHTPTSFLLRNTTSAFEFEGFTIPAGWNVVLPLGYTHRMPEYFADPERFEPERFLAPREEDKKTPYAWMSFGGGRHVCIGMGIAQIEIKTVLARLLRQFDLQLVANQDISPIYMPITHPKGGAKISFQRRSARRTFVEPEPTGGTILLPGL